MDSTMSDMRVGIALAGPSVRMVIVGACITVGKDGEPESTDVELLPVLAIKSKVVCQSDGYEESDELVVWLPQEQRAVSQDELGPYYPNWELAICPWSPEEDEDRLRDAISRVTLKTQAKIKAVS